VFKVNTFPPTPPSRLDHRSVFMFCTSVRLLRENLSLNRARLGTPISCVSTDGNKIPLINSVLGEQHAVYRRSQYSIAVRANCALSLTKHCAMHMCDRSDHYISGEWPASRPDCFTLRGNSSYTGAWLDPTIFVDVVAKRNATASAGYRNRFYGLPSRSQDTIHTELSRLCIMCFLREFVI